MTDGYHVITAYQTNGKWLDKELHDGKRVSLEDSLNHAGKEYTARVVHVQENDHYLTVIMEYEA